MYASAVRINLGAVLHLDRRAAHPGRRRHPQVRRARPAGGRRPARPEHPRVRHQRRARPDRLVRRAARRHVQHHADAPTVLEVDRLGRVRRPGPRALPAARPRAEAAGRPPPPNPRRRPRRSHTRTPHSGVPMRTLRILALAAVAVLGGALAACSGDDRRRRPATPPAARSRSRPRTPTCEVARTEPSRRHQSSFTITNKGSKVTEFYVYAAGDRVMGEVENIAPGPDPRAARRAAGRHVRDGLQARHDRQGHPGRVHRHRLGRAADRRRRSWPRRPRATSGT